jgi:hypothetical protein
MFSIEIHDLKTGKFREAVELVGGQIVIVGWESYLYGYYRNWTSDEADVFITWYQDQAVSQGVRLVKKQA